MLLPKAFVVVFAGLVAALLPCPARAALNSTADDGSGVMRFHTGADSLEARQFHVTDVRLAGQESTPRNITAWQVTSGTWNGQALDGLSLVLVRTSSENGRDLPEANCYVSHVATAAQRNALLNAFLAAQSLTPRELAAWHVEPAVIRFEFAGRTVIVHLGTIA